MKCQIKNCFYSIIFTILFSSCAASYRNIHPDQLNYDTHLNITELDSDGNYQRFYPVGLVLGPSLAIGNLIAASVANKNLMRDYSNEYIQNS